MSTSSRREVFTLYIQTNSPGEVTSWVFPICQAITAREVAVEICVFLTPCQYSTGQEKQRLMGFPGVIKVYTPKETLHFLRTHWKGAPHQGIGAVLFLGGDPWYSRLLGWVLKLPVFGYTDRKDKAWWGYKALFSKFREGDLMQSRVFFGKDLNHEEEDYILFLPGSRPQHFQYVLPFFDEVAGLMKERNPNYNIKALISPFISRKILEDYRRSVHHLSLVVGESLPWIKNAKWMLSLPGTNTSEAMYLHTPMVVVLPLNRPEVLILDGLMGLLVKLPVIGPAMMRLVILILKQIKAYYSLPNRFSGKSLVPEWVGKMDAKYLSDKLMDEFDFPKVYVAQREVLKREFPIVKGHAAYKICDEIFRSIIF